MERLDKLLSRELNITRSEAKALLRQGVVSVNGKPACSGDLKCAESDVIAVNGKNVSQKKYVYIMMNKPKGVISASDGKGEKTVIDILPDDMKRKGLFPAGRLDKDTTGFALITDDGEFAHSILSPKRHIDKTYIAALDKPANAEIIEEFKKGVVLKDEELLSAGLRILSDDAKTVEVVIRQGIYHQIKRMFKKYGVTVLELKRTKMGSLELDPSLKEGECRYITEEELGKIR